MLSKHRNGLHVVGRTVEGEEKTMEHPVSEFNIGQYG